METITLPQAKQLTKSELAVLIDQCETAIVDMIRLEGSDGCTTNDEKIYQLDNLINKLTAIYNSK